MLKKITINILKIAGRFVVVVLYYVVDILATIFDWFANTLLNICYDNEILKIKGEDSAATFEKKFSDNRVLQMAKSISPELNLKEIQGQLSISYRQARLVRSAMDKIKNLPVIRA